MNETSLQAYWSERLAFRLTAKQAQVLDDLCINGPATRAQLEKRTKLKLCCVCGRVNELLKAGYVVDDMITRDEDTGKQVHVIRLSSEVA